MLGGSPLEQNCPARLTSVQPIGVATWDRVPLPAWRGIGGGN